MIHLWESLIIPASEFSHSLDPTRTLVPAYNHLRSERFGPTARVCYVAGKHFLEYEHNMAKASHRIVKVNVIWLKQPPPDLI